MKYKDLTDRQTDRLMLCFHWNILFVQIRLISLTALIGEVAKLQRHLDLLRQEYVKLQQKLADSEQKYAELAAASGHLRQDHFVSRLMRDCRGAI